MISILVPYAPSTPDRDRLWDWAEKRWSLIPDAEILIGVPDRTGKPGDFNHPQAINRAAERASGDVFVIADADTVCNPDWLVAAVEKAREGDWVLASHYVQLNERTTRDLLTQPADVHIEVKKKDTNWIGGSSWSGVVVVPRDAFELLDGSDERHLGWGFDDICFGLALDTLWKPHVRLDGFVYHLWHPQSLGDTFGQTNTAQQRVLTEAYKKAIGDPEAMRRVREGHRCAS